MFAVIFPVILVVLLLLFHVCFPCYFRPIFVAFPWSLQPYTQDTRCRNNGWGAGVGRVSSVNVYPHSLGIFF